jgi:deoxycytidylate deaminase
MRYLEGHDKELAEDYCMCAAIVAMESTCQKSCHGAILVKDSKVIGEGWNIPLPDDVCNPCRRLALHNHENLGECNAIHAERIAIDDALTNGYDVRGSVMYHARFKGGKIRRDNVPSCTSCSTLVKQHGLEGFVLMQEKGYAYYDIEEFDRLSREYTAGVE